MTSISSLAQTIEIHYALEENDPYLSILQKSRPVQAKLEELRGIARQKGFEVSIRTASTQQDLLDSMNDSQTSGVIWIGHSKPAIHQENVYNAFMLDSYGQYMTKSVGASAHSSLEFFAMNTCFTGHINPRYNWSGQGYSVLTHDFEAEDNSLNQLTNIIQGTIGIFEKSIQKIATLTSSFSTNETKFIDLEISYRDLLSTQFGYDVFINDRLVGLLDKEGPRDFRGKTKTIKIPQSVLRSRNTIVVKPSDANRYSPRFDFPVDNILVKEITIGGDSVFNGEINIGDEDLADEEIGLSKVMNRRVMKSATHHSELRVEF